MAERKKMGEETEEEEEVGEFWFPLLFSHSDTIHSYETPQAGYCTDSH